MSIDKNLNYKIVSYTDEKKEILAELIIELIDIIIPMDTDKLSQRRESYKDEYIPYLLQQVSQNEGQIYFLEVDQKIVGVVAGIIKKTESPWTSETKIKIAGGVLELYVRPDYQKFGFGKILMEQIENYLTNKGCEIITVEAFYPNEKAKQFYQKIGYKPRNIEYMKITSNFNLETTPLKTKQ